MNTQNNRKNFALIGYPLGHSMSKVIHSQLFEITGMDAQYELIEVAGEDIQSKFNTTLKKLRGFNVTIPHKINIIPYLDELSERAELFGSVNTVDVRGDKTIGHNTDCSGFLRALEMADITLGGRVLLCGCGGVSRMIAFESVLAGAELTIAVRKEDIETANILKQEISDKLNKECRIILLEQAEQGYDLIVNGTPVGMYPNVDACPLDEEVVKSAGAVFDVIYNPIETKLITIAKQAGIKCSSGLSMLVWQAAVAEEIWNGVEFSNEDIKNVIAITEKELEA